MSTYVLESGFWGHEAPNVLEGRSAATQDESWEVKT